MLDLFRKTLYVRIEAERLRMLHVESGKEITDIPVLAIKRRNGTPSVVAAGREALTCAHQPDITLANGFKHPRTLIADFTVAEQTLKFFLKKVVPASFLAVGPIIVLHPLPPFEGGLTQIEIRAFAELGMGAGARRVYVWEGPELSQAELRKLEFSRAGGRLLHP